MIMKRMKLQYYRNCLKPNDRYWKVVQMDNSTLYNPGDRLNKKQVDTLCKGAAWDVQINNWDF